MASLYNSTLIERRYNHRQQLLRSDVSRYRFYGLDPQDNPLAVVIHRNADVYALNLSVK